jgi:hypothetical protein
MVDYLNKEHDLGLNVNNLPSDLSREQEAEIVSNLFERTPLNSICIMVARCCMNIPR